jgi:ferric-dicitrate binding protein FerR (iron transport regulator)
MKSPEESNIDEWLFHYFEGDLSPDEEAELEDFLLENPEYDAQFEAWGASRIQQESFVYPQQEVLLKPLIPVSWLHRAAVFSAIAVNAILAGFIVLNPHTNDAKYNAVELLEMDSSANQLNLSKQTKTPSNNAFLFASSAVQPKHSNKFSQLETSRNSFRQSSDLSFSMATNQFVTSNSEDGVNNRSYLDENVAFTTSNAPANSIGASIGTEDSEYLTQEFKIEEDLNLNTNVQAVELDEIGRAHV